MELLIYIAIAVAAITAIYYSIIVQASIVAILIVTSIATGFVMAYFITASERFNELAKASFDGKGFKCKIDASTISNVVNRNVFVAVDIAVAAGFLASIGHYIQAMMLGGQSSFVAIAVSPFVAFAFSIYAGFPLRMGVTEYVVEWRLDKISRNIPESGELLNLDEEVTAAAAELGIPPPAKATSAFCDHVFAQQSLFTIDLSGIQKFLQKLLEETRIRSRGIRSCAQVYSNATARYDEAVPLVNRSGLFPLVQGLDQLYAYLTSPEIRRLVEEEKYDAFCKSITEICAEIQNLANVATAGVNEDENSSQRATRGALAMKSDEAFELLGVGAGASEEEIKLAWRSQVKQYNVDHRMHLEPHIRAMLEERLKKLNAAKELLLSSVQ